MRLRHLDHACLYDETVESLVQWVPGLGSMSAVSQKQLKQRNSAIIADYHNGTSQRALAVKYGLSRRRIQQILSEFKVKTRRGANSKKARNIAVAQDYSDGLSHRDLAIKYEITHQRVSQILMAQGVISRRKREVDLEKLVELYVLKKRSIRQVSESLSISVVRTRLLLNSLSVPIRTQRQTLLEHHAIKAGYISDAHLCEHVLLLRDQGFTQERIAKKTKCSRWRVQKILKRS